MQPSFPRFSGSVTVNPTVHRDWSAGIVETLEATRHAIEPKPDVDVTFYSVSGEGNRFRSIAYHDLWMRVERPGQEKDDIFVGDGLEFHTVGFLTASIKLAEKLRPILAKL